MRGGLEGLLRTAASGNHFWGQCIFPKTATTPTDFSLLSVWPSVWFPFCKHISGSREISGDLGVLVIADHVVGNRAGIPLPAAATGCGYYVPAAT